nr:2921_t:CDS:2 [Entrophospora candida]
MKEIFEVFWVDVYYGSLEYAKSRAREIESNLKSENPIFYEEIKSIELPFQLAKNNPDDYIKPLDIVKRFVPGENGKIGLIHTCIYLGNRKIVHACGEIKVEIEDWDDFFRINIGNSDKIIRCHPVVAFKKPEKIIKHIANCIKIKFNNYSNDGFKDTFRVVDLGGDRINNCESFANRCVLGLNFSEMNDRRNQKTSREIRVEEEVTKTNSRLDKLVSETPWHEVNRVRQYLKNGGYESFDANRDGISMEDRIEVQPKSSIIYDMQRESMNRMIYGRTSKNSLNNETIPILEDLLNAKGNSSVSKKTEEGYSMKEYCRREISVDLTGVGRGALFYTSFCYKSNFQHKHIFFSNKGFRQEIRQAFIEEIKQNPQD